MPRLQIKIFFTALFVLFIAQAGYLSAQPSKRKKRTPVPAIAKASNAPASVRTVNWETQGISFTLPAYWQKDAAASKENFKLYGEIPQSRLVWKNRTGNSIEIVVDNSDEDGREDENLKVAKMMNSQRILMSPDSLLEKPRLLEINDVNGALFIFKLDPLIEVSWGTHRRFQGKAQGVFVSLRGHQSEIEELKKILQTIKISHERREEPVTKAVLSDAQKQLLAKGAAVNWREQGISVTLPAPTTPEDGYVSNEYPLVRLKRYWSEKLSLTIHFMTYLKEPEQMKYSLARDYAYMNSTASPPPKPNEPFVETDGAKYLEIDGVRGIEAIKRADYLGNGDVSACLSWTAYLAREPKRQMVEIELCSPQKDFDSQKEIFRAVLYSTDF